MKLNDKFFIFASLLVPIITSCHSKNVTSPLIEMPSLPLSKPLPEVEIKIEPVDAEKTVINLNIDDESVDVVDIGWKDCAFLYSDENNIDRIQHNSSLDFEGCILRDYTKVTIADKTYYYYREIKSVKNTYKSTDDINNEGGTRVIYSKEYTSNIKNDAKIWGRKHYVSISADEWEKITSQVEKKAIDKSSVKIYSKKISFDDLQNKLYGELNDTYDKCSSSQFPKEGPTLDDFKKRGNILIGSSELTWLDRVKEDLSFASFLEFDQQTRKFVSLNTLAQASFDSPLSNKGKSNSELNLISVLFYPGDLMLDGVRPIELKEEHNFYQICRVSRSLYKRNPNDNNKIDIDIISKRFGTSSYISTILSNASDKAHGVSL